MLFLDLSQLDAEATSLLAIVFVALVGAWRQRGYGNLRLRDGVLSACSPRSEWWPGSVLANAVTERALELSFAGVQLVFAWQTRGKRRTR